MVVLWVGVGTQVLDRRRRDVKTLYSGRGGSSSSGGVDNVPQRKASSTEYRLHASR